MKKTKGWQREIRAATEITALPIAMATGPVLGYFAGNFLDRIFDSSPWGLVIMVLMGTVASFRQVFYIVKKWDSENDSKRKK